MGNENELKEPRVYLVSDVHGAYRAYAEMKERLLGERDRLCIIGDVLDGNNARPEECMALLEDAEGDPRVELVLGNHELFHHLRLKGVGAAEAYLRDRVCQGVYFMEYCDELSSVKRRWVRDYLGSLPLFATAEAWGRKYFLVHGAPVPGDPSEVGYAIDSTRSVMALDCTGYYKLLAVEQELWEAGEPFRIVGGHTPTKYLEEEYGTGPLRGEVRSQRPLFATAGENSAWQIDCGCRANTLGRVYGGWASDLCFVELGKDGPVVHSHSSMFGAPQRRS